MHDRGLARLESCNWALLKTTGFGRLDLERGWKYAEGKHLGEVGKNSAGLVLNFANISVMNDLV
jgi:hypothetical protein